MPEPTIAAPPVKHEPWCPFFITHGRQECKCKPAVKSPTLSDVVASPEQTKLRSDYATQIEAARDTYATDELEIDDLPLISDAPEAAEPGVWVSAWVWVPLGEDE